MASASFPLPKETSQTLPKEGETTYDESEKNVLHEQNNRSRRPLRVPLEDGEFKIWVFTWREIMLGTFQLIAFIAALVFGAWAIKSYNAAIKSYNAAIKANDFAMTTIQQGLMANQLSLLSYCVGQSTIKGDCALIVKGLSITSIAAAMGIPILPTSSSTVSSPTPPPAPPSAPLPTNQPAPLPAPPPAPPPAPQPSPPPAPVSPPIPTKVSSTRPVSFTTTTIPPPSTSAQSPSTSPSTSVPVPTVTTIVTTLSFNPTPSVQAEVSAHPPLSLGGIIGIIVAASFAAALALLVCLGCRRRRALRHVELV